MPSNKDDERERHLPDGAVAAPADEAGANGDGPAGSGAAGEAGPGGNGDGLAGLPLRDVDVKKVDVSSPESTAQEFEREGAGGAAGEEGPASVDEALEALLGDEPGGNGAGDPGVVVVTTSPDELDALTTLDEMLSEDGDVDRGLYARLDAEEEGAAAGAAATAAAPAAGAGQPAAPGGEASAAGQAAEGAPDDEPTLEQLRPQRATKDRLGDVLVEMGLATKEQVEAALARQKETRKRLGQILVEEGVVSPADLSRALARRLGYAFLDLSTTRFDGAAAEYIDERLARRYGAVPVRFVDDSTLLVAVADPTNVVSLDELKIITGFDIVPAIASEEDIATAISRVYREKPSIDENPDDLAHKELEEESVTDIREATEDAPVVRLVNTVIAQAVDDGASDIHFEPQAKELVVRFRIDGVLHEIMSVPRRMQQGVISRLKIMADLDIAERRVPQDGRIGLMVGGKPIDMRVATLPTVYGEKVVMRLLDKSNVMLRLEDLGFSEKALKRFRKSFTKPYGAILVTGPTGSGKSTTLYATLNILNTPEKNIITVEDPVEYRLPGINQVQVNVRAGMTFAAALRSILRCDPDIVMIGEIRDRETAQIAVESALTGHLVLSTLHTNDAPGALSRLTEMGIEPFLTASAVDCVLAQRLARRLCPHCKEPYTATREMLRKNDFPPEVCDRDDVVLYRAKGCPRCNNTGYKGRLGLYEVMVVSEAIRRLTVERKSADEIGRVAQAEGMKTLREDGIDKVLQGLTSMEEIARVIV